MPACDEGLNLDLDSDDEKRDREALLDAADALFDKVKKGRKFHDLYHVLTDYRAHFHGNVISETEARSIRLNDDGEFKSVWTVLEYGARPTYDLGAINLTDLDNAKLPRVTAENVVYVWAEAAEAFRAGHTAVRLFWANGEVDLCTAFSQEDGTVVLSYQKFGNRDSADDYIADGPNEETHPWRDDRVTLGAKEWELILARIAHNDTEEDRAHRAAHTFQPATDFPTITALPALTER
jgi:hypothetical protein